MNKQGLVQKTTLTTTLSPLQIQTIKLIELPLLSLEQRVRQEMEENPVIDVDATNEADKDEEKVEDISINELEKDDTPWYKNHINNSGKDDEPRRETFMVKQSFTQSLIEQMGFLNLDERQFKIATFIIGSLEEDGYLKRDIDAITDDLSFKFNIDTDEAEIEEILAIIQGFEPAGVGARDLRECLLIQLHALKSCDSVNNAIDIVEDYFQEFANKHFEKIMSRLGLSREQMQEAMNKILSLNPKPGGQIDDDYNDRALQVVPDFILENNNGVLKVNMTRAYIPEIKISKYYTEMLERSKGKENKTRAEKESETFIKGKMDSAKWFIEALKQRHSTLQKTMEAILDFQREYFESGDVCKLKPMVLKDIAEKTALDISTISRVVNSKYIETNFGILKLKDFFSEGLETQDGTSVSTKELKKVLQELVDNEDKHKPLGDDQLKVEMEKLGYNVARRTIAKYRDQLGIPKSRLRKEL